MPYTHAVKAYDDDGRACMHQLAAPHVLPGCHVIAVSWQLHEGRQDVAGARLSLPDMLEVGLVYILPYITVLA